MWKTMEFASLPLPDMSFVCIHLLFNCFRRLRCDTIFMQFSLFSLSLHLQHISTFTRLVD